MMNLKYNHIDYILLGKAKKFYAAREFKYIETPWVIPEEYAMITSPGIERNFTTPQGTLTASAEQSFLFLIDKALSFKPYVRHQSITPCFRNEPEDATHSKWFMKLELFKWYDYNAAGTELYAPEIISELHNFVDIAIKFFKHQVRSFSFRKLSTSLGSTDNLILVRTGNYTYDIELNGIEIGSYGIRSHKDFTWIYGTGLAEPRFTYALTKV